MIHMNEDENGWLFVCRDCVVQMIQIDFRLTLIIADGRDSVRTTYADTCKLHWDGKEYIFDPEQTPSVAPILLVFNTAVSHVMLTNSGKLEVRFIGGGTLEVEASNRCEAWEVGCLIEGVGHLFVCSPEGEVTFFKGTKDHPRGAETNADPSV